MKPTIEQKLGEIIEATIEECQAKGRVVPADILRDFNTGFDSVFSSGVGLGLENTVGDVIDRTEPAQRRATESGMDQRVAETIRTFVRRAVDKRLSNE